MTETEAINAITEELLTRRVEELEKKFENVQALKNDIKYHAEYLNAALCGEINEIRDILQIIVDDFFFGTYEIPRFVPFTVDNFDYPLEHAKCIIRSIKKVMKFIG